MTGISAEEFPKTVHRVAGLILDLFCRLLIAIHIIEEESTFLHQYNPWILPTIGFSRLSDIVRIRMYTPSRLETSAAHLDSRVIVKAYSADSFGSMATITVAPVRMRIRRAMFNIGPGYNGRRLLVRDTQVSCLRKAAIESQLFGGGHFGRTVISLFEVCSRPD